MPGIYIHIPFCRQACDYCNFHFATSRRQQGALVQALVKEIGLTPPLAGTAAGDTISTIYFGGGTPSLLEIPELEAIFSAIHHRFVLQPDCEITLEANPDDIHPANLASWLSLGINRLSIGIQSFSDGDLLWMHRTHSSADALRSIGAARAAGFSNFSIDLIYGTPGLSDAQWKEHVLTAAGLQVPHLSCYALTVEPRTPLEKKIRLQQKAPADTEQQARQFSLLMDWAETLGYQHYEISNFAKPGFHSRHNSSYWEGISYYGFGPSAHAYDGQRRRWNVANNALYIRSLENGLIPFEEEILTPVQQLNEYIMTSLRTAAGLSLNRVSQLGGREEATMLLKKAEKFLGAGSILQRDDRLILTKEGKLFADGIAADLFF